MFTYFFRRFLFVMALVVCIAGGTVLYTGWQQDKAEKAALANLVSLPFMMEGEFVRSGHASVSPKGDQWDTWEYMVKLTNNEYMRVRDSYIIGTHSGTIYNDPGYTNLGLPSTGIFCGGLPQPGELVRVDSPTGYTKDVVITNLETGMVYLSPDGCVRPSYTYHYRISVRETGEILEKGIVTGYNSVDAAQKQFSEDLIFGRDPTKNFQIWEDGDPEAPILSPE